MATVAVRYGAHAVEGRWGKHGGAHSDDGASSGRCRGGRRGADGDESRDDVAVAEGGEELDPDGAAELRSRWFA